MAERPIMIPADCLSAIWSASGRSAVYFAALSAEHAMRLLNLYVECVLEERRAQQAALAEDDECWEWGWMPDPAGISAPHRGVCRFGFASCGDE